MINIIKRITHLPKIVRLIMVIVLVAALAGGAVYWHHYIHRSDLKPNTAAPDTGISVIFSPALSHTANLEIDGSNEQLIKTVNLVRANSQDSAKTINDPHGIRYNIALAEGVYAIKVTSSHNDFPPFTATVTVTKHTLTTENVSFGGFPG